MKKTNTWHKAKLDDVVDLRLSSVDKKTKPDERAVRLCNYLDVYKNRFIRSDMDFMLATATDREIAKCTLLAGDVVITKDSEKYDDIGVPALIRENIPNLVCGYHLAILRPIPEYIDGTYLFYAVSSLDSAVQFHSLANGVTRFGLRKDDILRVEVPLPPLPVQRNIADVLGTLDDKIELNRRIHETLEQMAQTLFRSWFVDFDPVRAKLEGRWRPGESLPGLPAELYDAFPDRLVESKLGLIPEGWQVLSLGSIANFRNGLALQKFRPVENEERLPVVKIAQLRSGQASRSEWAAASIPADCVIENGDIIFSWSGSLMVKMWSGGKAALNQHLFKVTSSEYPKWFYLNCIRKHLPDFRRIAAGKATTMGHIKREHLHSAMCAVPNVNLMQMADTVFKGLLSQTLAGSLSSDTVAMLRDTLLPKLLASDKPHWRDTEVV